ncbi:MAG TPA: EamA family transporter [Tepidiformaceae bacterium]|nr:EamA family transporter [Tepidiformaceae bacterium]HNO64877.1 EamA family transporter [Tepidiformaceae bacterium]
MSILLGLAAALSWGTSDFLGGRFTTRHPVFTVGLVAQATSFLLLLAVSLIARPALGGSALGWGLAAGLFTSFGGVALYKGLATGDSAVVAPLSACGALVPVAFAFASGDPPSLVETAGIGVTLVGVVLCSLPPAGVPFRSDGHLRPVLFGLGAAVGFGLFFVFVDQGASTDEQSLVVLTAARGAGVLVVGGAGLVAKGLAWPGRELPKLAAGGVIDVSANGFFALATNRGNIAVASVLSSLYPLQTLVLSRLFTSERFTPLRILGAVLALAGVAAISVG